MNPQDLAARIRADAQRYEREYGDRQDAEYQAVIDRDVADLRRVAAVVAKGDLKRAFEIASKFDTILRESISEPVWQALAETKGGA